MVRIEFEAFDTLFSTDKLSISAYHGHPLSCIHWHWRVSQHQSAEKAESFDEQLFIVLGMSAMEVYQVSFVEGGCGLSSHRQTATGKSSQLRSRGVGFLL